VLTSQQTNSRDTGYILLGIVVKRTSGIPLADFAAGDGTI
jgi:hypothetical protein